MLKHITLAEYRASKSKDYQDVKSVELGTGFIKKQQINAAVRYFGNRQIQVHLTAHQQSIITGGQND
ncbi:hypothetical protein [Ferrimonas lipolytica]|uniref:Uncharacterized protein n=1 Tax=Ferrimonas lipolytica TaxID=2724191 RepID=A0A6H1UG92_9GAMM|nr:hypothetical protein [Ferrimonas lipolytica]QIZ78064.1 hypothetical protein HER31_14860 [Ferrimonas lipolytica]